MMKKDKEARRYGAKFLAPEEVGSSIRYSVSASLDDRHASFDAELNLSDCNRTISWSAYGSKGPAHLRRKLKVAIQMMQRCLVDLEYVEAELRKYEAQAAELKAQEDKAA